MSRAGPVVGLGDGTVVGAGSSSTTTLAAPAPSVRGALLGGIACCLSLHNAEFQGLWPLPTPAERREVCAVLNLKQGIVTQHVQYDSVLNLLHGAVSYLRIQQGGFGAVGVSNKYADRSGVRYPSEWRQSRLSKPCGPFVDGVL